ncbi:saccharopine dehydrogenase-like oxidoreductase [Ornithodoros turicata]|uniref:saccharopine dehydrogenase-like oxidoreductase n=1 Tax=Ornithodoros turicata TaxID=34597 RepID=UPI0031398A0D
MSREFDVVLFGATGVTGVYVVEELHKTAKAEDPKLRWAVAGRSETKLKETLRAAARNLELEEDALDNIPTIIADVEDQHSLDEMVKRTKILLNTVGPYRFFGRPVVMACVQHGTHHLDVSGEPQYLEQMQNEFFKDAEEKGIFVIGACGFDSIPAEMTVTYLRNNFKGELGQVETFVAMNPGPKGMKINFGTWQSAIHGMAHASELIELRKESREKIFTKSLPPSETRLTRRNALFWSDIAKGWCLPFLGSDRSVLLHSEMFRYQLLGKRPAQIQTYLRVPSFLHGIGMILLAAIFGIMSSFSFGRTLLEKFPEAFSFGMVRRGGPTREQAVACSFTLVARGKGWEERLAEASDKHTSPPEKTLVVSLDGPDPAYVTTAICLVQAAMVILKEKEKMLGKGGALSPGAALNETSYLERLQKNGFKFQVL